MAIEDVKVIAHRGAPVKGTKENTLEAFERALAAGCDGIELDVHLGADGTVMVSHDHTLDRVFGKNINIWESTGEEIRREETRVPTLEAVIAGFKDRCELFAIEVKKQMDEESDGRLARETAALIKRYDIEKRCFILCLEHELLLLYREQGLACRLVPVYLGRPKRAFGSAVENGFQMIWGNFLFTTRSLVRKCKARGIELGTGYIYTAGMARWQAARGIRYIMVNRADLAGKIKFIKVK